MCCVLTSVQRFASRVNGPQPQNESPLIFSIWAATQTYADYDWQIATVTGKASVDEADYEAAAHTIIRMIIKDCVIEESPVQSSAQVDFKAQ